MYEIQTKGVLEGECRAPGLQSEESEILSVGESIDVEEEDQPDLDLAYDQLDAIKLDLRRLRANLVISPSDPCALATSSLEDTIGLTKNQQLLQQLRRRNCVLRCQLQRQAQHLHNTRKELKLVEALRCQLTERLGKMSDELDKFCQFKISAQHQLAQCIERNEQIKMCKVNKHEFFNLVRQLCNTTQRNMNHLVPMRCHRLVRYEFSLELVLIRIFLNALFNDLIHNY